ncbi:MAG: molybdopterin molybdotransferase MoeA [Lewinellaceae bacterium]|nr:molybdopterin molybdotransferase MoeA [Phaeodactylibacter sp.]MCB9347135.1 molybdopterin molybdotransferase MoeA [Lewinellaceae bacterium]
MIPIEEATKIVLNHTRSYGEEAVPLTEAIGRILRQDILADRDFPPFTRVTMDGIAIRYNSYANGQRKFPIEGMQAAGSPQRALLNLDGCLEVMTGAILPENADTVIRYEDIKVENGVARLQVNGIQKGQNAHLRAFDRKQGERIVKGGAILSPAEIGVAATVGLSSLKVAKLPSVAIISTGDELVEVEETPELHQIRTSNVYTIASTLTHWGIHPDKLHIADDMDATKAKLSACLEQYDVLILSGGVSKGKFDYIPGALNALGMKKLLHKVKQRPGKPFWFGESPNGKVIFALPGNPVSAFMCAMRYIRPWLRKSLELEPMDYSYAVLAEDFKFKPDLTYFLQVRTSFDAETGRLMALPVEGHGSGDLANLVDADAFLELPREKDKFKKGKVFPLIPYR